MQIAKMASASDSFEQEQMAVSQLTILPLNNSICAAVSHQPATCQNDAQIIAKLRAEKSTLALSHKRKMQDIAADAAKREELLSAEMASLR